MRFMLAGGNDPPELQQPPQSLRSTHDSRGGLLAPGGLFGHDLFISDLFQIVPSDLEAFQWLNR